MPRTSLSQQLVTDLRDKILRGRLGRRKRLPSEGDLARLYDVSRPTIREALRALETEGVVSRRHGLGTFVADGASAVSAGIDRLQSFTETIRRAGHTAADRILEIRETPLTEAVAALVKAASGTTGILVRSIRSVDGTPAIYSEDIIPSHIIRDMRAFIRRRSRHSLLEVFQTDLKIHIQYAVLSIEAVRARGVVRRLLRVRQGTPLIFLSGATYDGKDRPLYATFDYVRTDRYRFGLIQRPH